MTHRLTIIAVTFFIFACGGNKTAGSKSTADGKGALGRIDEGKRCDVKDRKEALVDLNQDGIPDVRKVYATVDGNEVLVCREADMNFDGVKDIFVFFDEQGAIIRDEIDLDYDKQVDIISTYAKGKVVKQEMDTNSDGLVDRVRHLKDEIPFRVEGDMDGDGRVDLWEYYEGGKLVRLGTDDDGDGRADTWSKDAEAEESAEAPSNNAETEEGVDAEKDTDAAPNNDMTDKTAKGAAPPDAAQDTPKGADEKSEPASPKKEAPKK